MTFKFTASLNKSLASDNLRIIYKLKKKISKIFFLNAIFSNEFFNRFRRVLFAIIYILALQSNFQTSFKKISKTDRNVLY